MRTYAREKTDLLNRPTFHKWIIEKDSLISPIHTFMLFLDTFAQEKYIQEMLLRMVEFLYAFLQF